MLTYGPSHGKITRFGHHVKLAAQRSSWGLGQNLAQTLPTMQLDRQQFCQRFMCVMLVAANEAWATQVWSQT